MKKLLAASVVLVGMGTSAYAADLVTPEPAVPEVTEQVMTNAGWDGAYFGLMGGAGWLRNSYDGAGFPDSSRFRGGVLGTFAGWNMQMDNNIVLGLEGDFSYNWNESKVSGLDAGTDLSGSVRGRVGYAVNENALVYGAAGWTVTRGYLEDPAGGTDKKNFHGYTVGAGVDYKVTDNIFARAEYRFNDYQSKEIRGVDINPSQHQVLIGVGMKF